MHLLSQTLKASDKSTEEITYNTSENVLFNGDLYCSSPVLSPSNKLQLPVVVSQVVYSAAYFADFYRSVIYMLSIKQCAFFLCNIVFSPVFATKKK